MPQSESSNNVALRNVFGLLTPDGARVNAIRFLDFISEDGRTSGSQVLEHVDVSKEHMKEIFLPLVAAADLAVDVFADKAQARLWMLTANNYFFGLSPYQMIMRREGIAVNELLLSKKS